MIDILLATYNGEQFLREQIDSLLSQTYSEFRILIRDDGSKDSTLKIIEEYRNYYPEKIISIDNCGINLGSAKSFFELLRHSIAEYVMFCDQDDIWNADKLEMMLDFYEKNIQYKNLPALVHSSALVVDENLKTMHEETDRFNNNKCGMEKSFVWQLFQNDVTGCTVLINAAMRTLVNKIDFTNHTVIQHDYLLSQIAYLYGNKFYMNVQTIKYRQHSNNLINAKKISFIERLNRKIKKGIQYPYYDQVETLFSCEIPLNENLKKLLIEFASLRQQNKVSKVFWHIKHRFFRTGNVFFKVYQLFAC